MRERDNNINTPINYPVLKALSRKPITSAMNILEDTLVHVPIHFITANSNYYYYLTGHILSYDDFGLSLISPAGVELSSSKFSFRSSGLS